MLQVAGLQQDWLQVAGLQQDWVQVAGLQQDCIQVLQVARLQQDWLQVAGLQVIGPKWLLSGGEHVQVAAHKTQGTPNSSAYADEAEHGTGGVRTLRTGNDPSGCACTCGVFVHWE